MQFKADGTAQFGLGEASATINGDGQLILGNGIKINIGGDAQGLADTLSNLSTIVNGLNNVLYPVDASGNRLNWNTAAENIHAIKAVKGFFSTEFISALGLKTGDLGGSTGGTAYDRLDAWADYTADKAGYVLSAYLGADLNSRVGANASSITSILSRLGALENGGTASVEVNGSGNAITDISKAGTAIVATKGATFIKYSGNATLEWEWGNELSHVVGFEGGDSHKLRLYNGASIRSFANVYSKSEIQAAYQPKGDYALKSALSDYLPLSGGTMANTTLVGNLNADLLDGKHLTEILNSNVASATKLYAARTLWGQSFDGTANVSGDLTGVGNISSGYYGLFGGVGAAGLFLNNGSVDWYVQAYNGKMFLGVDGTNMQITSGGFVGIGLDPSESPLNLLHVNGTIRVTAIRIGDATITWDAANGGLKIDKGLYSQSYISANGAPSAQNISETTD